MDKEDLALNNQQWLICHKTKASPWAPFIIIMNIIPCEGLTPVLTGDFSLKSELQQVFRTLLS